MEERKRKNGVLTPANLVTIFRVVLTPIWLLGAELSVGSTGEFSISAFIVFVGYAIISLTDKLDGYLARSRNEVTSFGKFLDPIADKLAVVVALCFLLEIGMTNAWILLVIIAREFLVSGLRMVVATQGVVVAASNLGKWKTAVTMVSICGLLLARSLSLPAANVMANVSGVGMLVAVALTIWSGVDYFVKCWPYLLSSEDEA